MSEAVTIEALQKVLQQAQQEGDESGWQREALCCVLQTEVKELEADQRVYMSSEMYGNSRYHLVERRDDGIQLEQVDVGDRWNRRINFSQDEIPPLLKTLLLWYLKTVQPRRQHQEEEGDGLGDVEEHPF